ncbi:protein kinase, putative [Eimeria tenella]|uniref:Protein kinase, putative n=1 Tax=Eimeria tenella TaxID=5802 RepID=U6KLA9_EIMTE|nr:protein kinase, putative [Eimeria tenella]CDJ38781.1 protein kinase, putative [Eimeria tenella]|eukprot:XP_013229537.1 protein kinase, putative [Eimeria tenella]
MEREKRALITREVQIMRKLQHENIVKYGGSFNESQALYIVMQHLSGGSLYGLVRSNPKGKLSEASARKLFLDVARGVAYLHSQSVVHRDLKLENMLLDDRGRVRLIDFGFASLLRPGVKCRMACGTPSYMPPEILKKKEYEGPAADMWSLGVVLYAMLHGCYPFKGQKPEELYANIAAGEYVVSQSLSTEVKALLQGLLFLNPEGRLKAEQVLSSPWLTAPADYGVGISPSHSRSDSSSSRTPKQHGGEGHPDPKAPNSTTRASSPAAQPTSQGPCPPSAAACCTQPQTSPLANKPKPQQDTLQPPDHNKQQQQPQQQSKNRQQHQPPSPQQQQQQEQQQQCGSQQPLPEPKPHSRFLSKVCEIFAPPASRTQRPLKP